MRLAELQYNLPPELIAQQPAAPRDASRLMVVDRGSAHIEHRVFHDIGDYLERGDCLVVNDTRVIPARFHCRRESGGRIEVLFLTRESDSWQVLLKPSGRLHVGERIRCESADVEIELIERGERGEWKVRPRPEVQPLDFLARVGQTPLPPYIQRSSGPSAADDERYQTVYAAQPGAVAAPTAGLHFTPELLRALSVRGVRRAEVTLHVGLGTFAPLEVDDLRQHRMHFERLSVSAAAADAIALTRRDGRNTIAVGTTVVRVLESFGDAPVAPRDGGTDIFIYPPFAFRHTNRLITNFHLPGSTLLALVSAFAGVELMRAAYEQAIERRYRFYSFGDAMLIL